MTAEGDGEGAPPVLLPAVLKLGVVAVVARVAEVSSLPEASALEPAAEEGDVEEGSAGPLSSASSLGLSPGPALGTPTDSRTGSVFELGCNCGDKENIDKTTKHNQQIEKIKRDFNHKRLKERRGREKFGELSMV